MVAVGSVPGVAVAVVGVSVGEVPGSEVAVGSELVGVFVGSDPADVVGVGSSPPHAIAITTSPASSGTSILGSLVTVIPPIESAAQSVWGLPCNKELRR